MEYRVNIDDYHILLQESIKRVYGKALRAREVKINLAQDQTIVWSRFCHQTTEEDEEKIRSYFKKIYTHPLVGTDILKNPVKQKEEPTNSETGSTSGIIAS